MQNCPKGFFRDAPNDLRCIQCAQYCADCEGLETCFECEPVASLYRGQCYLIPTTAADTGVDFETFLASGYGIAWDEADAASWDILMASRRLQEQPMCDKFADDKSAES